MKNITSIYPNRSSNTENVLPLDFFLTIVHVKNKKKNILISFLF